MCFYYAHLLIRYNRKSYKCLSSIKKSILIKQLKFKMSHKNIVIISIYMPIAYEQHSYI